MDDASQLPLWVEYLQALLTPVIAALAVVIGVAQWRTNHMRAVLDLFERRMTIHDKISDVVREVLITGKVRETVAQDFWVASARADQLFGPEVRKYLNAIFKKFADLAVAQHAQDHGSPEERVDAAKKRMDRFNELNKFFVDFPALVRPYVKLHQKSPWV